MLVSSGIHDLLKYSRTNDMGVFCSASLGLEVDPNL